MNPSRLAELERQRALVREHLAWIEREIARETGATSAGPVGRPLADTPQVSSGPTASGESASKLAAYTAMHTPALGSSVDEYQPDPKNSAESARRGCMLAAVATFVVLVGVFLALYFYRYSDRPLLFPAHAESAEKK